MDAATELRNAIRDETALSLRVFRRLACGQAAGANLALSPLSLHAALVLLGAGAQGATLDQIVAFLGRAGAHAHATLASQVALNVLADSPADDAGPKVRFANGVWVDAAMRLKVDYARLVAGQYRAEARSVPFKDMPEEARRQINEWFENSTAGRIKDFLPEGSVNSETPAVLGNALYFKGAWEKKFDTQFTQDGTFYLPNGSHVRAPFMSSRGRQYIVCHPDYKVLKLPYARGRERRLFSMYIYLPNERDGLQSLLHKLGYIPTLLENSTTMKNKVPVGDFRLPKFTISYKIDNAKDMLQDLGLLLPFDFRVADFSEMLESFGVFFSAVIHESFVEVNEEGTEAAAATASCVSFGRAAMTRPVQVVDFVADHPFMFLIKEELTGVVVFVGQVVDPSLSCKT